MYILDGVINVLQFMDDRVSNTKTKTETKPKKGNWESGDWEAGVEQLKTGGRLTVNSIREPGMVCNTPLLGSWPLRSSQGCDLISKASPFTQRSRYRQRPG